jgi:hypothetical protein
MPRRLGFACDLLIKSDVVAGSSIGRTPDFESGGWRFDPSPASPVLAASIAVRARLLGRES